MTIETITIKDWIESDHAKSLESVGDHEKWKLFEIIPSDGAWEDYEEGDKTYDGEKCFHDFIRIKNRVYSIEMLGLNVDRLKNEIGKTLIGLRNSTISFKREGERTGGGKLIIQARMSIIIDADHDSGKEADGRYKIMWRGAFDRIPNGSTHKPRGDLSQQALEDAIIGLEKMRDDQGRLLPLKAQLFLKVDSDKA